MLPILLGIFLGTENPARAASAADDRFGLVGTGGYAFAAKFGLTYFTLEGNYVAGGGPLFHSVNPAYDPPAGFKVVREAAKLNMRTDALGESNAQFQAKLVQFAKNLAAWYPLPSWSRGPKPAFPWYHPDAEALVAAESLQIVETIRREKSRNPAMTGTVWEIGNEPNLFPAITPAEYAAIFTAYHKVIKAEDADAVVAMGALFLPEPSQDLKARLGEELEARLRAELQAAGAYAAVNSLGYFDNLVGDVEGALLSRMLALPAREYLRQVLDAAAAKPDIITYHVYPYDDRAPFLDSAGLKTILDTTVAGLASLLAGKGITASQWITEFGNIRQDLGEDAVAADSREMIGIFKANAGIARWFHYKSTGADDQFALFSSGPPPLTRLAAEASFSPPDGRFPCGRLNAVGRAYYRESHGGAECRESAGFAVSFSAGSESSASPLIHVNLDTPSDQTVTVAYAVKGGTAAAPGSAGADYGGGKGTLTFAPGETSQLLPLSITGDTGKEPDETLVLVLRDASGAALSADSLHTYTIRDDDTAAPADGATTALRFDPLLPRGFSLHAVPGAGGRPLLMFKVALPQAARVNLEILDGRGRTRAVVFRGRLEAGRHTLIFPGSAPPGIYHCRMRAAGRVLSVTAALLPE